jgi:hypothetical protein
MIKFVRENAKDSRGKSNISWPRTGRATARCRPNDDYHRAPEPGLGVGRVPSAGDRETDRARGQVRPHGGQRRWLLVARCAGSGP